MKTDAPATGLDEDEFLIDEEDNLEVDDDSGTKTNSDPVERRKALLKIVSVVIIFVECSSSFNLLAISSYHEYTTAEYKPEVQLVSRFFGRVPTVV